MTDQLKPQLVEALKILARPGGILLTSERDMIMTEIERLREVERAALRTWNGVVMDDMHYLCPTCKQAASL